MTILAVLLLGASASALPPAAQAVRDAARGWRRAHEGAILREFADLLAIPNVASDTPNIRRNAEAILGMLERRHVAARLLARLGG